MPAHRCRALGTAAIVCAALTALSGCGSSGSTPGTASAARTDIPDSVLLTDAQLPTWAATGWTRLPDRRPNARAFTDPDHCDPAAELSSGGSPYPADLHPSTVRTRSWVGPQDALTSEAVIVYSSQTAADADFARHHGWLDQCTSSFSWTELPHAQSVVTVPLPGDDRAYAIRVAMYPPGRPSTVERTGTPGSQGCVYFTAVQQGNAVAFLTTTGESGALTDAPSDPGPSWIATTESTLHALLAATYPAVP